MNRSERRRRDREKSKPEYAWRTIFDAEPMANGMPPSFLLYLLNEKEGLARLGKLLTASLWLQSQMVALICLEDSPELRDRCTVENGRPPTKRVTTCHHQEAGRPLFGVVAEGVLGALQFPDVGRATERP